MMAELRSRLAPAAWADDVGPLVVSWVISAAAGAAWLALVHLMPLPAVHVGVSHPDDSGPIQWNARSATEARRVAAERGDRGRVETARTKVQARTAQLEVAGAFAATIATRVAVDVAALIGGVQPVRSGLLAMRSDRAALGTERARATPGIGAFGRRANARGSDGSGVGKVAHGGAILRAGVRVKPLPVVTPPEASGAVVDPTEAGAFVRAKAAQLQYCYERAGRGSVDLAGVVTLRLTLGPNGAVREAEILRRTWSGPGAADAEACLLASARGWRVPSGADGATMTLPISFTRQR